jgi:ribonuclease R
VGARRPATSARRDEPGLALPGGLAIALEAVRGRLERAGRTGAGAADLAEALATELPPADVSAALEELEREGWATHWNRRWFALRWTDWVIARVRGTRGGDGLLESGEGGEVGYFVGRRNLKGAREGDTVLARPHARARAKPGRLPEATVLRVLEAKPRRVTGYLATTGDERRLVPYEARRQPEIRIVDGSGTSPDGTWVVAELDRPSGPAGTPTGRVVEALGTLAEASTDTRVVLAHYEIPQDFSPVTERAAAGLPSEPTGDDLAGREDLRDAVVFTIDGETARDFDDAIGIERRSDGSYRLAVHIADVAHYVPEGSALDLEAYARATSVYFPDRVVPMLPPALSDGLCSLRPDVPRLAQSVFLDVAPDGSIRGRRFADTILRSRRRLTYGECRRLLEDPRPSDRAEYGEVLVGLEVAASLMRALYRRRLERGSVDFDLPEGDVILDSDGVTVGVKPGERNVAHRIVEECMIAANEAVAQELSSHECQALFRVHDPPTPARVEELRELLRPLGLELPADLGVLHPSHLQRLLRAVVGRPEEAFVSTVVLRSLQRALYAPEERGHYALGSRHYTHFTSPIRRYPDLLVHRRLRALRRGEAAGQAAATRLETRLPRIAAHCSANERRAERAEREVLRWKLVRWMSERVGERFSGRITGVQPFGLFVELDDLFVDGLVPIQTLTDDFYAVELEQHRLVGRRSGRCFRLADAVEVELIQADPLRRELDLRVTELPPAPVVRPKTARRARR